MALSVGGAAGRPAFPPDDLRTLYTEAYHSNLFGEHYEAERHPPFPVKFVYVLARLVDNPASSTAVTMRHQIYTAATYLFALPH